MRVIKLVSCVVLLILLSAQVGNGQDYAIVEQKVDQMVSEILSCKNSISGLTLSIIKDGRTVLEKGYGTANIAGGKNVTENTLFGIASLSKAFTTTLLMKILERYDNISVNTVVTKILGDDFAFADEQLNKYATLQDLMSHRLGLPSHNYIRFQNLTRLQLARSFRYIKAKGKFRSTFYYNNIVYGLLTHITEVLGKDTWENLMKKEIFQPLGMNRTTLAHVIQPDETDVALGYKPRINGTLHPVPDELNKHWGSLGGSGSVMSSAREMTRWMMFHLNKGQNQQGDQVVSQTTIRESHLPRVIMTNAINNYITVPDLPTTFVVDRYASAWRNGFYRGLPTVSHTGETCGYGALIMLYPTQKMGIFMALNGRDRKVLTLTMLQSYIADLILGHEPWLNQTTACTFPQPWKVSVIIPAYNSVNKDLPLLNPLKTYIGRYYTPLYGILEIQENDEVNCTNCLKMVYGISTWDLYPSALNYFRTIGTGVVDNFSRSFRVIFTVPEEDNPKAQAVLVSFASRDPTKFQRNLKRSCGWDCPTMTVQPNGSGPRPSVSLSTIGLRHAPVHDVDNKQCHTHFKWFYRVTG